MEKKSAPKKKAEKKETEEVKKTKSLSKPAKEKKKVTEKAKKKPVAKVKPKAVAKPKPKAPAKPKPVAAKAGEAKAVARFVRMAPRKIRLVMDAIRGKSAGKALDILKFTNKRAATTLTKVLKSAIANAENNYKMNSDDLYISKAFVDQGPTLKRFIPRARGRASSIRKKSSHITIVVSERRVE